MMWIKLYDTYNKVKDIFEKPKLVFWRGKWINNPCLPVSRNNPTIHLVNYHQVGMSSVLKNSIVYHGQNVAYYPVAHTQVKTGIHEYELNGKQMKCDVYTTSYHKLPKNCNNRTLVWNRDIRKKLKKYHLSWILPQYNLPMWLSFHIFNYDMMWKTKYDDNVYEFPPAFTIVLFGYSFSWWLKAPESTVDIYGPMDDHYWETILDYIYDYNFDINKMYENMPMLSTTKDNKKYIYFRCRPEYLKIDYKHLHYKKLYNFIENHKYQYSKDPKYDLVKDIE